MPANSRQVGGEHYKSDYQHWDWVCDTHIGYLEGCATKYLSRWRKKDGLKDLEKAAHYIEKTKDMLLKQQRHNSAVEGRLRHEMSVVKTADFCTINNLVDIDAVLVSTLALWRTAEDLDTTAVLLDELIKEQIKAGAGY